MLSINTVITCTLLGIYTFLLETVFHTLQIQSCIVRLRLTSFSDIGQVYGERPAGTDPGPSLIKTLRIASPDAWAGKKQSKMAATSVLESAKLKSMGPPLNSRRIIGAPFPEKKK